MARVAPSPPAPRDIDPALEPATAEILAALGSAGVDVLLLKGPAIARLLYRPDEYRSYSDIDLLVAPRDRGVAEQSLRGLGYSNFDSGTGVDDVGGVIHAHTWIRRTPTGATMVDLHHWLSGARAPAGEAWDALLAHRTWIEVAERPTAVLDRPGQAMHLALHAAQHAVLTDRQQYELGLALERWPTDVWDGAAGLAAEIDATRAFAAGLRLLPRGAAEAARLRLPLSVEEDWSIRNRAERPRGTFHVQAFSEASTTGERLRIVRTALFPSRAWIEYHHPTAVDSRVGLVGAYAAHLARTPLWAARALLFSRRARRATR